MSQEITMDSADINPDDVMRILVASDVHLGYEEKNQQRGEDSFLAFEEVLQHAVENDVDAVLLGGDLFHIANPSTNTLNRCLRLLKTYTLGDKPIQLEVLRGDDESLADTLSGTMNYEDPNVNIAIPVFSIHGNHDDTTGFGHISAMELLSTNGFVNYFGKWNDLNNVVIKPILLKKGETKLALYGLSHIADGRLCRLFEEAKVFMQKPEDPGWFNILVLHQNRADRGYKKYLPEKALPSFLNLVIWGHEHDCRIQPEQNPKGFFVSQPGSTVATSLSEGESIQKCCALLSIHKEMFRMDPIPLQSVRPFEFETVDLATMEDELDLAVGDVQQKVMDFAAARVEAMIERSKAKLTGNERQPTRPLIRLRLIVTEVEQQFNTIRFGQRYADRVANPLDVILFQKKLVRTKKDIVKLDGKAFEEAFKRKQTVTRPEDVVDQYFVEAAEANQMEVLCPRSMKELCRRVVDHEDDDAADRILKFYESKVLDFLTASESLTEENLEELLSGFHDNEDKLYQDMLTMLDSRGQKSADPLHRLHPNGNMAVDRSEEDDDDGSMSGKRNATTTARGAKAARGTRARGAAAAKTTRGTTRVASKVAVTVPSTSRSQSSIASMFSQQSASNNNSSMTTVASRTSIRNAPSARGRRVQYDSDASD
ncbi:double-strand break repair protein MRE11-like [Anopheles albimanus]|uniref:double-strand break repair protein MRE11-like n=1 Tax=Anopheles albimanus TaxID=7167 RepID=UPI0016407B5B|nr:double-strand break repair protein MRE11-like [Anopheles albimanus]